MMLLNQQTNAQKGFTIVELMIATTVLSVILLLSTVMITGIGNLYYKGVNQSRVQDAARTITDDVVQHLQLTSKGLITSPAAPPAIYGGFTVNAYCVDNTRYSYVMNVPIGTDPGHIAHVLWRDSNKSGSCTPVDLTNPANTPGTEGAELMSPNSRLTDFTVSSNSPYNISVAVAYGDDDLLNLAGANTTCKGGVGGQFCATASLVTTAVQRVK